MRNLWLVLVVLFAGSSLTAAELSFDNLPRSDRTVRLFEPVNLDHGHSYESAFETGRHGRTGDLLKAQLVESAGDVSDDQWFGAGTALGVANNPIGIGASGWFDFYILRYLAVSTQFQFGYGIVTDELKDGGDGVFAGLSIGAKFVMDFPGVDINRWFRPFAAFYPAGFLYFSATEEVDPPDSDDTKKLNYSDIFYHMYGGAGVDFFLTPEIAIGAAIYVTGRIGGSKHKDHGVTVNTRGRVGVFFEYARLAIRF